MPVFISYSHKDRDFVDELAAQLVHHRVKLWIDRWELRVGDSLTSCIERAIEGASALLIVLSKAAVSSDWCRREINAGLLRELEERRVMVLPVLKDECEIPLFLREKLYADFRSSPDRGIRDLLDSLARFTNDSQGRVVKPEWHMDWALDWGTIDCDGKTVACQVRVTIVEQAVSQPYCVLSVIEVIDLTKQSTGQVQAHETFQVLAGSVTSERAWSMLLEDQFEKTLEVRILRAADGVALDVKISSRRLGEDTGKDIVFHAGQQIQQIAQQMAELPILRDE